MSNVSVIPANAGWFLLVPLFDENDIPESFIKQPIIAWGIETMKSADDYVMPMFHTFPITIEGFDESECDFVILKPDGTIEISCDGIFNNENDALTELKERHKARRKSI